MSQTGYKRFLNRRKWQTSFSGPYGQPATPDTQLGGTHSFRFSVLLESTATVSLLLEPEPPLTLRVPYTFSYVNPGSEQTYDVTISDIPQGYYNFRLLIVSTMSLDYNANYLAGSFEPNTTSGGDGPYFAPVWDPGLCAVNGTQTLPAPSLTITTSQTTTTLNWSQVTSSTGYTLQKSLDGSTWSALSTTDANTFVLYDTDFLPNTLYYYRVKAVGNGSNYLDSPYTQATTTTGYKQVATPNLGISSVSSTSISLSWTDVANESYYELSRSLAIDGTYTTVATFSAGSTSYTNNGLVTNTRYYYRMVAKGDGSSYTDSEYRFANARTT
jgi:hypothetical protein